MMFMVINQTHIYTSKSRQSGRGVGGSSFLEKVRN